MKHPSSTILEKNLANNSLANFYLFSGPQGVGKFSLAQDFARKIFKNNNLETNPDFFLIEKEEDKKNIRIEQVRDLISKLSLSSFLNSYKVVIIKNGENLNQSSANALLKVLEEIQAKTIIIMTTDDISLLPKTIVSRARLLNFSLYSFDFVYKTLTEDFKLNPSKAKTIARISAGRMSLAISLIDNLDEYIKKAESLVSFLSTGIHQRMSLILDLIKEGEYDVIDIWESIVRDLMLLSVNKGELVQNVFIIDELRRVDLDCRKLQQLKSDISKAREYIGANMNLKLALEYIAVNV